jgi:hypothetical protein
MRLFITGRVQWPAFVFGGIVFGAVVLLPWWRNHDILRDFCDYGLVMAAVGRMSSGDHPYVDFVTPIQTLQFTLGSLAEALWGARYLSLTYANAAFIVASFVGLTLLLFRPLGRPLALLLAATIVVASSTQHTIVWYNAVGVAWLTAVIWLTARAPTPTQRDWGRWLLVPTFLWLGGMTKLTYQVAALAFAVLFTVRFAVQRKLSWKKAMVLITGFLLCGTILPLVTELLYTGATFEQWAYSVVVLPSSRSELLKLLVSARAYWETPHDYYKPMYFSFVGAWGVSLLAWAGIVAARQLWKLKQNRWSELSFLAVSLAGAWICGGVLLATNFEIAYLSGAAWLALAIAIVLAFTPDGLSGPTRPVKVVLAGAALSLLVPGWISAWSGARALWGVGTFVRGDLVSASDLPERFAYLKGLWIEAPMHGSLQGFPATLERWASEGVSPSSYFFINATEWMVRAVPEARHRGLPLWLFRGTTITENEIKLIDDKLRRGSDIQVVVEDDAWDVAYPGIEKIIGERFEPSRLGAVLHLHRLKSELAIDVLANPAEFAASVKSNLLSRAMTLSVGSLEIRSRGDGRYLCSPHSSRIDLGFGVHQLKGQMIAELLPHGGANAVPVTFRLRQKRERGLGRVVYAQTFTLTSEQRDIVQPFAVTAAGEMLSLEIDLPPGAPAEAGWRELKMDRSGPIDPGRPFPLNKTLNVQTPDAAWTRALFSEEGIPSIELAAFGPDNHPDERGGVPELFSHVPGEVWLKLDRPTARIIGEFGLRETAWTGAGQMPGLKASVVYSKGGRFETLFEKELRPSREEDRGVQAFHVALPESEGWIGLVITPLDPENISYGHAWWRKVRPQ